MCTANSRSLLAGADRGCRLCDVARGDQLPRPPRPHAAAEARHPLARRGGVARWHRGIVACPEGECGARGPRRLARAGRPRTLRRHGGYGKLNSEKIISDAQTQIDPRRAPRACPAPFRALAPGPWDRGPRKPAWRPWEGAGVSKSTWVSEERRKPAS